MRSRRNRQLSNAEPDPGGAASAVGAGTRDRIVDAAVRLLVNEGPTAFTVAAVASIAKVSKGGLLYHFPSQKHLASGIVTRSIAKLHEVAVAKAAPGKSGVSSTGSGKAFDAEIVAGLLLSLGTERSLKLLLARAWFLWEAPGSVTPDGSDYFSQAAIEQLAQWIVGCRKEADHESHDSLPKRTHATPSAAVDRAIPKD